MSDANEARSIVIDPVTDGVDTRIAPGAEMSGDFKLTGGLWVDGKVSGTISVAGILVVAPGGEVSGTIDVRGERAILAGRIGQRPDGSPSEVTVRGIVELADSVVAHANITATGFDWHHGAQIEGQIRSVRAHGDAG